jgi:hypothetical protein
LQAADGVHRVESDRHEAATGVITQRGGHGRHSIIELNGWKLALLV